MIINKNLSPIGTTKSANTISLAGLLRLNLISLKYDKQGNRRGTEGGWTADDFVARWHMFERFVDKLCLIQFHDPDTWMTAQLNEEERLRSELKSKLWKGQVDGVQYACIVDWDFTLRIEWRTDKVKRYPRDYCAKVRLIRCSSAFEKGLLPRRINAISPIPHILRS